VIFVFGATLLGYMVPEMVFLLSPHAEKFKRVPFNINLTLAIAFGCLAYGIRA
jgi:hypothetical protein